MTRNLIESNRKASEVIMTWYLQYRCKIRCSLLMAPVETLFYYHLRHRPVLQFPSVLSSRLSIPLLHRRLFNNHHLRGHHHSPSSPAPTSSLQACTSLLDRHPRAPLQRKARPFHLDVGHGHWSLPEPSAGHSTRSFHRGLLVTDFSAAAALPRH